MTSNRNPQAEQMAHESMVRTLTAQADAIWPQEQLLFERYPGVDSARILDVGCGTGEITLRLAERYPEARLAGVDLIAEHLETARRRGAHFGNRVHFQEGDAFHLPFADGTFDLTVCRHMLQAVPDPHLVLAEMKRVTRPGGRLHLLAEDYAMIHFHPVSVDTDLFWLQGPVRFAESTGTDLRSGRRAYSMMRELGLAGITVDYVTVDTLRVPRETFAAIWEAWRDGYSEAIVAASQYSREEVAEMWRTMIACIRDPDGYAVWQIPVLSGVTPRAEAG